MKTPDAVSDTGHGDALHLDDYLPYRLSVASNRVSRLIAKLYQDRFGLSIWQWRVLAILGAQSGLTAGAVASRAAMDKMAVSRAVSDLVLRKLIVRNPSNTDGRVRILALSETGIKIYEKIAPLARQQEQLLLDDVTPENVEVLKSFLRTLESRAAALIEMHEEVPLP